MTFRHGKNTKILINQYDLSSFFSESSVSQSVETGETTTFTSSAKSYVVGLTDSTMSLKGFYDGDTGAVDEIMEAALATDNEIITVAPEGLVAGSRVTTFNSLFTSYEITSPVADVVSISMEGQTNDRMDRGISLYALTATSATGSSTAIDNATSTTNGGVGQIHVPINTRNGTSTIKIQHSADNSTWADLITFSVVSTTTVTSERVAVTGTVNRYLRVNHTIAGSTGSTTYHANFARR
ncbi:hypothetical protein UFOVP1296_36 [uncultured Caudovirales phage]|uniref:Major tail protein n=1 Tax=uncultured Caudovirales phage TaxID=2100421 RepID=A0A6J5RNP7_9CAUD|nr:hypothetical protein UFOVP471_58 [uncultured Caudovirales phage]CAB4169460.1 hypothetical protein UFOVP890_36 [uncultured Caudovirales phage]CAB4195796.1 hypothetical protein UFOVP1296_36 [uncultured Caudovirales phage]